MINHDIKIYEKHMGISNNRKDGKVICLICGMSISVYKTIEKTGITYSYGTCACEMEYDKYCNLLSSYHKRIDIKGEEKRIWNLRPTKKQ